MAKKKISSYINLTVIAGKATPAPPIGPALGQKGVNIMEFCKAFNAATKDMEEAPTPVVITVYADKSFTFIIKTPPVSFYLKKFAKVTSGASATKKDPYIGQVTKKDCAEIARIKMKDLNTSNLDAATRSVIGSAASMGISVID